MSDEQKRLLVFGKYPQAGHVKTRLIPALGAEGAAQLYKAMLTDTLQTASRIETVQTEFWCQYQAGSQQACEQLAHDFGMTLHWQVGDDLGERMLNAFDSSSQPAVLIGSDCPGITTDYLQTAFDGLAEHDVVLGPSTDGGYVLIGLKQTHPSLFDAIAWSTETVLATTRERLEALAWKVAKLPVLTDIDTADDLGYYPHLENFKKELL